MFALPVLAPPAFVYVPVVILPVAALPDLAEGDNVKVVALAEHQHFTQPPARFTEASLVKALEEYGIGRPSTYAPTISTLTSRYVTREGRALVSVGVSVRHGAGA